MSANKIELIQAPTLTPDQKVASQQDMSNKSRVSSATMNNMIKPRNVGKKVAEHKWITDNPVKENTESSNLKREQIENLFRMNIRNEFGVGVIKIVTNPHAVIKIFWIVCLLGSLAISFYLIIGNFVAFFRYGVTTTVRQLSECPSLFPEVIICNQNMITSQNGYNLSMDPNFPTHTSLLPESTQMLLGHSIDDILLSCGIGIECSASYLYWFFDRNLGNCYAFNSGNNSSGQITVEYRRLRWLIHGRQHTQCGRDH